MALKALIDEAAFTALPEVIQGEYEKNDSGQYVLAVEEKDFKKTLTEFRNNNIKLQNDLKVKVAEAEKYKDIDPTKYADLMEKAQKYEELENKKLEGTGNTEEIVTKRTAQMRKDHEQLLNTIRTEAEKNKADAQRYRDQVRLNTVNSSVREAVSKLANVKPGAWEDILNRASKVFVLNDGDQLESSADNYDSEGKPLTLDAWAKQLLKDNAYLFESGGGGGAGGGNRQTAVERGGGMKRLVNPDAKTFSKYAKDIAAGKVEVVRTTR